MDKDRSGKGQGVRGDGALQVGGETQMRNTWTMILSSASLTNTRMGETYLSIYQSPLVHYRHFKLRQREVKNRSKLFSLYYEF